MTAPGLLVSALLAPAEFLLNELLTQDTLLADKLFRHSGTVLQVNCTSPPVTVFLVIDDSHVRLTQVCDDHVSASFTGSLPALLGLLLASHPSLHGSAVEVRGDMQKAQAIQTLLSAGSIDWEFHFSRLFGEVPVQAAADLAHKSAETLRRNADSLKKDLDEYIHEEARLLPGVDEVELFYQDLDALMLRIDRLRARLDLQGQAGA